MLFRDILFDSVCKCLLTAVFFMVACPCAIGETQPDEVLTPPSASEPFAKLFALNSSHDYLRTVSSKWYSKRQCVTCHTNGLYLISSPLGSSERLSSQNAARRYLAGLLETAEDKGEEHVSDESIVATAALLAISESDRDALHPITVRGLDKAWDRQDEKGHWKGWLKCNWPPYEIDDHFGVTLMAIAMGGAPTNYVESPTPKQGIARLRSYLKSSQATTPHQEAMLLWASLKLPGLLSDEESQSVVHHLLSLQQEDGGWNLISLGEDLGTPVSDTNWKRTDGADHDRETSDGYATGFVTYLLLQHGALTSKPAINRGLDWLKRNQRSSGRWYTRSPRRDGRHYISNAGTSFAVLALSASED